MKFLTNIDLNKNELQNAVIQNLAVAPANAKKGQLYYNSTDGLLYQYNGTQWIGVGTTYDLNVGTTASNTVPITLVSGSGVTDTVNITGAGGATITSTATSGGTGTITITTANDNTTYTFAGAQNADNYTITVTPSTGQATTITIPLATATKAGLMSKEDYSKLSGIEAGAQVNTVTSVNEQTGAVSLTYSDVGADVSGAAQAVQDGVESGSIIAGKAEADASGNVIADTYATQTALEGKVNYTDKLSQITGTMTATEKGTVRTAIGAGTGDGTITKVQANGVDVASSGTANIPAASTSVYGVTQLVDAVNTTDADKALTANQGKVLNDRIDALASIGRFLSLWNATTGLPTTNPTKSPYTYHTGDYFRVTNVNATATSNLIPDGPSYTIGVASTTHYVPTTQRPNLEIGDIYYYDGTQWMLEPSGGQGLVQDVQVDGTSVVSGGIANVTLGAFGVTADKDELNILDGVTATTAEINVLDGITATTGELNVLHGITASTQELNYTDGVTSNIQTQLDAKGTYSKPSGGIPKTDLASAVQTSLGKADSATQKYVANNAALTTSGGACLWDIPASTHGLGNGNLVVQLYEVATGNMIMTDVMIAADNDVTITFISASNISAGTYRVVIIG